MLEPDNSKLVFSAPKDGDHIGVFFHNVGWVMGVVVAVFKECSHISLESKKKTPRFPFGAVGGRVERGLLEKDNEQHLVGKQPARLAGDVTHRPGQG